MIVLLCAGLERPVRRARVCGDCWSDAGDGSCDIGDDLEMEGAVLVRGGVDCSGGDGVL